MRLPHLEFSLDVSRSEKLPSVKLRYNEERFFEMNA